MLFKVSWEQFQQFLLIDKHHSKKPQAVHAEHSRFRIIERFFAGKKWDIDNFRQLIFNYEQKGAAQGTINKLITMGKHIDEYLNKNITQTFKLRTEKIKKIDDILNPDEIVALANVYIKYSKHQNYISKRQKALIMLLGTTGCRISEALNLKWTSVYRTPLKYIEFLETKNGEDREVWLDDDVFQLIDNLPRKSEMVFASSRTGNLLSQQINADLKKRAIICGINLY